MTEELVIIGGGPAGMAAALAAYEKGVSQILILERDKEPGGILNQCIHNGFGLHTFQKELTGPEYAAEYYNRIQSTNIQFMPQTMVTNIQKGKHLIITAMNKHNGILEIETKAVVLAMGCRERPRGAMNIPGTRPAGIFSAGTAQRYINIEGQMPGQEVVIVGSGDIGLIMARRMTLQGAKVKLVAEIMPYSGGLKRNIVQCLDDYHIPLLLSHTVTNILGNQRVEGVTISRVDENLNPIPGTEKNVTCDTILFSCGLIPENELTQSIGAQMDEVTKGPVVNARFETTIPGVFACGNVLHVHDLVDNVSKEASKAGEAAADYVLNGQQEFGEIKRPVVPAKSKCILPDNRNITNQLICIGCPVGCLIQVDKDEKEELLITGNSCSKGEQYARNEMTAPKRGITSIVSVQNGTKKVIPVKTNGEVPKDKIFDCMKQIRAFQANAPIKLGDILIHNLSDTGIDLVATGKMEEENE